MFYLRLSHKKWLQTYSNNNVGPLPLLKFSVVLWYNSMFQDPRLCNLSTVLQSKSNILWFPYLPDFFFILHHFHFHTQSNVLH